MINEEDKVHFNSRFDSFFKNPSDKSMILNLVAKKGQLLKVKMSGKKAGENDSAISDHDPNQTLIITITDVSDLTEIAN